MKNPKLLTIIILLGLIMGLSSCRRHHSHRERNSARTERRESRHSSNGALCYSFTSEDTNEQTKAEIERIAQSEDYDKMLDLMMLASDDLRKLSKLYLKGNMTDASFQSHINNIQAMYGPIQTSLETADSEGKLTYNQHKRQIKIMAEYFKTIQYVINRVAKDINNSFR